MYYDFTINSMIKMQLPLFYEKKANVPTIFENAPQKIWDESNKEQKHVVQDKQCGNIYILFYYANALLLSTKATTKLKTPLQPGP